MLTFQRQNVYLFFRIITEIIFFKTSELMDDIKSGTL